MATNPQSAYDLMDSTLKAWGLASLIPHVRQYVSLGYDSNTVQLYLQDTPEWKKRFAGNEIRKAQGLSPLSPAEYIATEEQYRNVMQAYGLPKGFYDSHDDFNKLIGGGVSPQELQDRVNVAHDTYLNAPDDWKQMWSQYFGTKGDAIAAILDPDVATQVIKDRAAQVQIGGTALENGFTVDQSRAQEFAQHGTTLADAQKAYSFLKQNYGTDQNIADRFNTKFGQQQEENDLLLGDGQAAGIRDRLYAEEKDQFAGHAGHTQQSLGTSQSY